MKRQSETTRCNIVPNIGALLISFPYDNARDTNRDDFKNLREREAEMN